MALGFAFRRVLLACLLASTTAGVIIVAKAPAYAQSEATQIFKDRHGRILGSITGRADGRQQATDYRGYPVGSYDPRTDRTFDEKGKVVGQGNLLSSLIASSPRVLERDRRNTSDPPPVELSDLNPPKPQIDPRDAQEALLTSEDRDLAIEAMQRAAQTAGRSTQEWINSRSDNRGKFEFEPGEFTRTLRGHEWRCRKAVMTVQTRDGVVDRHGQIICFVEVRRRWAVVEAWRL